MPSFDIVSEIDLQEVDNAMNQAKKEIESRYDFKGAKIEVIWDDKEISFSAQDEYKLNAMKDVIQSKLHRRGVDIKSLKFEDPEKIGGMMLKQKAALVQGIEKEIAKKITKSIKDSKLKVQTQVEGEKLRVTSKSIDELQATIGFCKKEDFGIPLQFTNMRS